MLKCRRVACFFLAFLVVSFTLFAGCTPADPVQPDHGTPDFDAQLLEKYPEYCGLDASNGLDVYVWQMAAGSYSFGVLPHSETPRDSIKLIGLKGANSQQMRQILSAYNIDESQTYIIPWQNPISSYIGEWWLIREGEDSTQKQEEYVQLIKTMLFG